MINDNFEKEYSKSVVDSHKKKFAQFFTPLPFVDLMSEWLLGNKNIKNVLEPAFGLGIFSRLLIKHNKNINIKAFEIDKNIFEKAKDIFSKYDNVKLLL